MKSSDPEVTPKWPLYQSVHTITHVFSVCESTETKVNEKNEWMNEWMSEWSQFLPLK